jgi:hypothetical protein
LRRPFQGGFQKKKAMRPSLGVQIEGETVKHAPRRRGKWDSPAKTLVIVKTI